jgi:hypothetical protein
MPVSPLQMPAEIASYVPSICPGAVTVKCTDAFVSPDVTLIMTSSPFTVPSSFAFSRHVELVIDAVPESAFPSCAIEKETMPPTPLLLRHVPLHVPASELDSVEEPLPLVLPPPHAAIIKNAKPIHFVFILISFRAHGAPHASQSASF